MTAAQSPRYSDLIWDWNGTLFDDVQTCIKVKNQMLRARGMKELSGLEEYRRVFCFPVIRYYEKLGFDFAKEDFSAVAEDYVARYDRACRQCELQAGAKAVLNEISAMGLRQYLVSAAGRDSLARQMEKFAIDGSFCEIIGTADNFAGGKGALARGLVSRREIDVRKLLMVGDTLHDFEVAQEIGCGCVLIPGGHHSRAALKATGAKILENLTQLPNYIKEGRTDDNC